MALADLRREVAVLRGEVETLRGRLATVKREKAYIPAFCTVADSAVIAPEVTIWASETTPVNVGERTKISRGAEILGPVSVGDKCFINRDCYIRPGTTIGDDISIGPFVSFMSDGHEIGPARHRAGTNVTRPIVVGDGTWIGGGVTVVGGVTIGKGCVVAAGAVVTSDVPDNCLVGGVPAKILRRLDGQES
ncbi:acyltransferase [Luteococcus sp.]|uniref:acyltransferase n=1 Tax=Luteococcus sp. TaxID=1969402 RepID=UPI003734EFD2